MTSSILAGSVWGGGLSLLAQQDSVGVVSLLGTAGAVIGGGTAWGLTRFGLRPSPAQALWYANATSWGTLAGIMAWSGSGSADSKLKYGLLVGGETVGVVAGIWGARRFAWTAPQILFANSLVLGSELGLFSLARAAGGERNATGVPPLVGYGTAPLMLASVVAARAMNPSANDLHLAGVASASGAWSAGLLASGRAGEQLYGGRYGSSALTGGLALGYLGGAAASPWVEIPRGRSYTLCVRFLS